MLEANSLINIWGNMCFVLGDEEDGEDVSVYSVNLTHCDLNGQKVGGTLSNWFRGPGFKLSGRYEEHVILHLNGICIHLGHRRTTVANHVLFIIISN